MTSIAAKVQLQSKLNFGLNGNKKKGIYRKIEFHVVFHELPEKVKRSTKEFYEKINKRLNERRILLKDKGSYPLPAANLLNKLIQC